MLFILTCVMYTYTLIIDNTLDLIPSCMGMLRVKLYYIHAYFRYLCMLVLHCLHMLHIKGMNYLASVPLNFLLKVVTI